MMREKAKGTLEEDKEDLEDEAEKFLKESRKRYIKDVQALGHPLQDIHYLVNKGVYSKDMYYIFELLNEMKHNRDKKAEKQLEIEKQERTVEEKQEMYARKRIKKEESCYYCPLDEIPDEEVRRMGYSNLAYNKEKHIGYLKLYTQAIFMDKFNPSNQTDQYKSVLDKYDKKYRKPVKEAKKKR